MLKNPAMANPQSLSVRVRHQTHQWLNWADRAGVKRTFDIGFSLAVLLLFSPFYLAIATLVAISSHGPVFYVQERVGKNYRHFGCIKFRTMVNNADQLLEELLQTSPHLQEEFDTSFKLRSDPRITWIGRLLRTTSLDEFPQFWNVLMGDMSVVGPRPLVPEELCRYGDQMDYVIQIRPGLTGLWQVSGRNDIPYAQRIRIDAYYVKNRSFWMDMVVVTRTIGVVLFPKNNGAY
ncbi:MAG: sugar transferase [Alkalinema sp. FL-bin-369]|nr:sugar transferase [Leptolyngbyaceae cyanobacterium LF-bin-369]